MWKPFSYIWSACKFLAGIILLAAALCLLVLFLFGAPCAIIAETWDLIRMDAQTQGEVTQVEILHGEGGSVTQVTYHFVVNGVQFESQRMFPGFFGDLGTYTRGEELAEDFQVGQPCIVYFDSSAPTRCSLQRGWFQWSIGFTVLVWGALLDTHFSRKFPYTILFNGLIVYGIGLLLVGPIAVTVSAIHWHLLTLARILAVYAILYLMKRKAREETDVTMLQNPAV